MSGITKKKTARQPEDHTFRRLMKYVFSRYAGRLLIVALCVVLGSVATIVATMFMQRLIDNVVTPGLQNGLDSVKDELWKIIGMMVSIYVVGIIANTVYPRIQATVTQGTLRELRKDMFHNMESLPISYFDAHTRGDIMSTYTNDADSMRQLIGQSIPSLIQSLLTISSIVLMMLYYSIPLTLIVFVIIALMLGIVKKLGGRSAEYMVQQQESLAREEGYIEEMMQGAKVVKVFCHEEKSKRDFDAFNEQLFQDSNMANRTGNVLMPILGNMGNIMYVLLAFIGAVMVFNGFRNVSFAAMSAITAGIIVTFLSMARQLTQTIAQASNQVAQISMGIAGARRVFQMLDEKPEQDDGYVMLVNAEKDEAGNIVESKHKTGLWAWKHYHRDNGTTTYVEQKGDIYMENVDFSYSGDKLVLEDVSIYAKPGQKIAFVGATGAGKTTITNLINRFYDIEDGKIRLDGININKIKKPDLRRSLGMVLQDVNLFSGTVMDNIRYGRLDATDEECITAAKLANADDFISRLPEGYDTFITNNGASLSQGQRQLISIARAAVADPPVMILDEATSSIDTRTEALVQKGMDNLMKGRTVLVIAHRLSTVQNSDCIMVLDHGRIIERGTHDDLIAEKGTYYQLYTGAFELE